MTPKHVITAVLLLFAAGSAAYVLLSTPSAQPREVGSAIDGGTGHGEPAGSPGADPPAEPELIVYYMDMGKDCTTCLQLENYTYETLETHFPDELAAGEVVWRTVDLDNPANEHFIEAFGLYTKSIVLVRLVDGEQVRFDSLSRIWELVYDKEAYMAYIQEQVRDFLDDPGAPA